MQEGGADLLIVLLVGSHGSQLLFFHDLHEALLQALAHQHLQQWLYLQKRSTCVNDQRPSAQQPLAPIRSWFKPFQQWFYL